MDVETAVNQIVICVCKVPLILYEVVVIGSAVLPFRPTGKAAPLCFYAALPSLSLGNVPKTFLAEESAIVILLPSSLPSAQSRRRIRATRPGKSGSDCCKMPTD